MVKLKLWLGNGVWSAVLRLLLPCTLSHAYTSLGAWEDNTQHQPPEQPTRKSTKTLTNHPPNKQPTSNRLLRSSRITLRDQLTNKLQQPATFGQATSTGSCSLPEISVDTSMVEAWPLAAKIGGGIQTHRKTACNDKCYG